MLDEKDLQAIADLIDAKLTPVISALNRNTEILSEHTEILSDQTTALNELIRWADDAQVVVKIPFAQTAEAK